jgi:voltage-gated potassium channel
MSLLLVAARLVHRVSRRRELALLAVAAAILVLGGILFALAEHVSIGTGLYWSVTTASTVGYGDVTPHNSLGRVIAVGVMLTTIPILGAVFALFAGASALARIRRLLGMDTSLPREPFILVLGSHPVVPRALTELARSGLPLVLVADAKPPGADDSVRLVAGDPTDEELLRRCQPAQAARALIACTEDADTLVVAVAIHALAPELEVYALTQSPRVARALRELGVTYTLAGDELVAHTVAKSLETPQAGDLLLQLVDSTRYRLREIAVDPAMISHPLSKAREVAGTLVLGISRGARVDLGVGDDPLLSGEDRLIVLAPLDSA